MNAFARTVVCFGFLCASVSVARAMHYVPAGGLTMEVWGSFSTYRLLNRDNMTSVDIALIRSASKSYWLLERSIAHRSGQTETSWATSADCKTIAPALDELGKLTPMSVVPPVQPQPGIQKVTVVADGGAYRLDAPVQYPGNAEAGRVRYDVGSDSPLATWIDQTLAALEPCWKSQMPAFPE